MNKLLTILQTTVVLLFVLINVYLLIFNWRVYTVSLEVDYGFGTFRAPIVLVAALIGLVVILLLWLISYVKELKYEVRIMKLEEELNRIKTKENPYTLVSNENNLSDTIAEMQRQIEALEKQKAPLNNGKGGDGQK